MYTHLNNKLVVFDGRTFPKGLISIRLFQRNEAGIFGETFPNVMLDELVHFERHVVKYFGNISISSFTVRRR